MNRNILVAITACALTAAPAFGQPSQPNIVKGMTPIPGQAHAIEAPKLTRFDLDFPGGTPKQLVAAIEAATDRPLNVVIPDEYANEDIPALRMTQVTVAELFRAMEAASIKTERAGIPSPSSYNMHQLTSISFQTTGPVSDNSIWYFRGRQKPPDYSALETKPSPAKVCRFYALTPYLEQGLKVEDITTAIQTGWKMLGEKETPSISFHKETKLLIAVGEAGKLETIDSVLAALRRTTPPPRLLPQPANPAAAPESKP